MLIDAELKKILVCPTCHGELEEREKEQWLVCGKCRVAYPVKDGIPVMLVEEAVKLSDK